MCSCSCRRTPPGPSGRTRAQSWRGLPTRTARAWRVAGTPGRREIGRLGCPPSARRPVRLLHRRLPQLQPLGSGVVRSCVLLTSFRQTWYRESRFCLSAFSMLSRPWYAKKRDGKRSSPEACGPRCERFAETPAYLNLLRQDVDWPMSNRASLSFLPPAPVA